MTISEQIRETALYARKPWDAMSAREFFACCDLKCAGKESMSGMPDADLRTFMLLVAEALE